MTALLIHGQSKGVLLRELTEADDQPYFTAIEENREHLDNFGNRAAVKYPTINEVVQAREQAGDKLRLGIWVFDGLVGAINATPNSDNTEAEIGYWLTESATGHGYATIAVRALTRYLCPQYDHVFAVVNTGNTNSANVLLRAGYQQSGEVDRDYGRAAIYEARK